MGRKAKQVGEVNKSAAIRDLLKEKPDIKANDAVSALAERGIAIKPSLFYIVKGKVAGGKKRRRKNKRKAMNLIAASVNGSAAATVPAKEKSDALATIRKIKGLAAEVGGLRSLRALVEALSE
jgi:hypothetical protein